MKIGYARVSTKDQNLDMQIDALKSHGCEKIYREKKSGSGQKRDDYDKMLLDLRPGDTLVVWKLDRLGRSLKQLVNVVDNFKLNGIHLKSINDQIDTSSPTGQLIFHLFAALADFEKELIRERTQAGLKSARARGRKGGRPKGISEEAKTKALAAETLYKEGKLTVNDMARNLGISKTTLYSYLRFRKVIC